MLFNSASNSTAITEQALKEQYKRTRVAIGSITEACYQKQCRERLYLSNSSELVGLIRDFKLLKNHPWLQDVAEGAPSASKIQSMITTAS